MQHIRDSPGHDLHVWHSAAQFNSTSEINKEAISKNTAERHQTRLETTTDGTVDQEVPSFANVPIIAPEVDWLVPVVAIFLQLTVVISLAVFAFVGVWVEPNPVTEDN